MCGHCDRDIVDSKPIPFREQSTATGDQPPVVSEFCSNECLQKYRMRGFQRKNQQHVQRNLAPAAAKPSAPAATQQSVNHVKNNSATNGNKPDEVESPTRATRRSASSSTSPATDGQTSSTDTKPTIAELNNNDISSSQELHEDNELDTSSNSTTTSTPHEKPHRGGKRSLGAPRHHYETFGLFNWKAYLDEEGGTPAPQSCFKQNPIPPPNTFEVNMKLEATDPRNKTSICIGTVVGLIGPRIQVTFALDFGLCRCKRGALDVHSFFVRHCGRVQVHN